MPDNIIAILDANVLYPFLLRDLLLTLAQHYLYQPKWSDDIEREWSNHLIQDRPDIEPDKIKRITYEMNRSFNNAKVYGYEEIENDLQLPDPDDRHVLAAAIVAKADFIVTFNIKDFDKTELTRHGIEAVHPDEFILKMIDRDADRVKEAIGKLINRRKNPPVSVNELINRIQNNGLTQSAKRLRVICNQ
jgi:predicted nucleic acid-binding protein